jgi:hypothetical protein
MNSSIAIVTKELVQVSSIKSKVSNMSYKFDIKSNMVETAGMCPPWHLVDTKMDNVKDEMNNKSHNILKFTGSHIKHQCSIDSHCSGHRIHKPVRLNHILLCMSDSGALIWDLVSSDLCGLFSLMKPLQGWFHRDVPPTYLLYRFSFLSHSGQGLHYNCAGPFPIEAFLIASPSAVVLYMAQGCMAIV